ncbi:MAG: NADH-quinone oxidoreductase subunit J [Ignavibacteriaceae bacterium]|nr:NADH-quinone oxidoreductase subunit J [Ignavibacteriaceae bacterium]
MNIYDIIFYIFALATVGSAFMVVTTRNIVHAAFYLLLTFFGVTGIYVLLTADFVAIVQLVVYVGGILILLIFGVMLTNKITNVQIKTGSLQLFPAAIGVGLFAGILVSALLNTEWKTAAGEAPKTTLNGLGFLLMNEYIIVFEVLGVLLLVALVGAASIARK